MLHLPPYKLKQRKRFYSAAFIKRVKTNMLPGCLFISVDVHKNTCPKHELHFQECVNDTEFAFRNPSSSFSPRTCFLYVGLVGRYSEPQPKAWPNLPGHRTGLFPGDGPAESPRHPLQERVRANPSPEEWAPSGFFPLTLQRKLFVLCTNLH